MSNTASLYDQYKAKMQRLADVRNASAVLQWDQETYLPAGSAALRGQQLTTLSDISHSLFSEDELGGLLNDLLSKEDTTEEQKRNVQRTYEDYTRNKKYSSQLVRSLSDAINKAYHAWIEARKQNSFAPYEKPLDDLIQIKKEEASVLEYDDHPYNALLDEFEKGATVNLLDGVFENLLPKVKDLYNKVLARPQVDDSFLQQHYPKEAQWKWGMYLVEQLNFDLQRGRQDISEHPFTTSFNPDDVRITTRISENDFTNMTWSCIHEVGHGLYEQGFPLNQYGLPLGEACSYSIHESQSRLWENSIGRSRDFWQHYLPELKSYFPEQLKDVDLNSFYRAINKVQPSLIRTDADELSYHFHVYIRYQLEKKLLEGSLQTTDIPAYWKELYKELLDVDVPDDKSGSLQDVHWSHGSFGYFPTYSLGSFYAAQFFNKANEAIPGLQAEVQKGNTLPLLQWLRENIHNKGKYYTSEELCKEITGKPLDISYFNDYLLKKYSFIYTL